MEPYVMHLVHVDTDDKWHLNNDGYSIAAFDTKGDAEDAGKARGHQLRGNGTNSQLVIYRQDGSIETAYTYGENTRDILGK